jgi:hypothetical protein
MYFGSFGRLGLLIHQGRRASLRVLKLEETSSRYSGADRFRNALRDKQRTFEILAQVKNRLHIGCHFGQELLL